MEFTPGIFMFIVALAAVVNGLGIVRIVGGLGEFVRRRESLDVSYYWVHSLLVLFQLLIHVLLWWSLIGLRDLNSINFLQYLYVLVGPVLLYLATCLLIPDFTENTVDLRAAYWRLRKAYYSILPVFWIWTMLIWPVFGFPMAPTWKGIFGWMTIMIILRFTENAKVHAVLVSICWLLLIVFIGVYAIQLGGVASQVIQ